MRTQHTITQSRAQGMTLLEVILALALFSLAAVAIVQQITTIAQAAMEARTMRNIEQRLEGVMDEYSKKPQIAELNDKMDADGEGVSFHVKIIPVQNIRTKAGIQLANLFRITVRAEWLEGNQKQHLEESTLRYAGMYNPVQ
jgi:prepilin-type N-terminal cleavage/methylation domain-containing protein